MQYKKYTEEKKLDIVHKFKNYRGTLTSFCKGQHISKGTLYKWLNDTHPKNQSKFINLNYIHHPSDQKISESAGGTLPAITIITSPFKISNAKIAIDFLSGCKFGRVAQRLLLRLSQNGA